MKKWTKKAVTLLTALALIVPGFASVIEIKAMEESTGTSPPVGAKAYMYVLLPDKATPDETTSGTGYSGKSVLNYMRVGIAGIAQECVKNYTTYAETDLNKYLVTTTCITGTGTTKDKRFNYAIETDGTITLTLISQPEKTYSTSLSGITWYVIKNDSSDGWHVDGYVDSWMSPEVKPVVTSNPKEPEATKKPEATKEPVVTEEPTKEPTKEPEVTKEPEKEPVVTEEPKEEPAVTEEPKEEPVVTEEPTEEPVVTEVPKEEPAATEVPEEPTQEPIVTPTAPAIEPQPPVTVPPAAPVVTPEQTEAPAVEPSAPVAPEVTADPPVTVEPQVTAEPTAAPEEEPQVTVTPQEPQVTEETEVVPEEPAVTPEDTSDNTVDIEDTDVPLSSEPAIEPEDVSDNTVDIEDSEVPLSSADTQKNGKSAKKVADAKSVKTVMLDNEPTPLSSVPETGDDSMVLLAQMGFAVALAVLVALAGLAAYCKKKQI